MSLFYNVYSTFANVFGRNKPDMDFIPQKKGIYKMQSVHSFFQNITIIYDGKSLVFNHGCECNHPLTEFEGISDSSFDVEYLNLDLSKVGEITNLNWTQELRRFRTNILNIRLGTPSSVKGLLQKKLKAIDEIIDFLEPLCVVIEIDQSFMDLIIAISKRADTFLKVPFMIFRVTFGRVEEQQFLHMAALMTFRNTVKDVYPDIYPNPIFKIIKGVLDGDGKYFTSNKKHFLFISECHNGPTPPSAAGKVVVKGVQKMNLGMNYEQAVLIVDGHSASLLNQLYESEFEKMREEYMKEKDETE